MPQFVPGSHPPPDGLNIPLVHKVTELYKSLYLLGRKLPKRDHFGIHLKIESLCLEIFELVTTAALQPKIEKVPALKMTRIKVEVLKRLIRSANELKIIETKTYLQLETELQELSRMANGWLKYLNQ